MSDIDGLMNSVGAIIGHGCDITFGMEVRTFPGEGSNIIGGYFTKGKYTPVTLGEMPKILVDFSNAKDSVPATFRIEVPFFAYLFPGSGVTDTKLMLSTTKQF
jgi:hypothetical protein